MSWEAPSPASTARKMARPPTVGVGRGWTFRSEGRSMAPDNTAAFRTTGVATNAVTALAPKTTRYGITMLQLPVGAMRTPLLPSTLPLWPQGPETAMVVTFPRAGMEPVGGPPGPRGAQA